MKRRDEYGLPHDLQTSVCRSGRKKKGRLRCGGDGRARKKRSSSLLPRDSVCCSAGQSILSSSTARVTTSSSSSYCRDWGGSSTLSISSSLKEDWSSVEPVPREEAAFLSLRALPERALDLEAVDGDRDSPVSISCSRSNCEPHECRRRSASAAAGPEPRGSLVKIPSTNKDFRERSVRSGKRSQWGQSAPSLNAAAACPAPKQAAHCSCVSPAVMKRLQGDTHGLNKRDLPSPLKPLLDIVQCKCNQCSVLSSAGLCISLVKVQADKQSRPDTQRARFWMTEGCRRLCRRCFYASWSLTSPACDVAPFHWSDYTADSEPVMHKAFPKRGDAARVPEKEHSFNLCNLLRWQCRHLTNIVVIIDCIFFFRLYGCDYTQYTEQFFPHHCNVLLLQGIVKDFQLLFSFTAWRRYHRFIKFV